MSDSPFKGWMEHLRSAILLLLIVAAAVRLVWALIAPVVPILVSLAVVLFVLGLALFGRFTK